LREAKNIQRFIAQLKGREEERRAMTGDSVVKMKMVPIRSMFPIGPNKKWLIYKEF
jgi:hypothetical protein